jgi:hypothetical protein
MDGEKQDPEIVTYRIPRIEVYQVTDDEICRIEETCGHVSQDLTFATSFLSFGTAFLLALLKATFSATTRTIFIIVVLICGIGVLFFGSRWWWRRKKVPDVITKIRSRKTEPQASPTSQP